ncbi:MAG: PHP domain-containing protein [Pseudomonadota bacterium]
MIDLHVHTNQSDGTLSPAEVVGLAARTGLKAIAVTDHDTVSGVAEALREGEKLGVEVVPGVELSVQAPWGILHILGYFVDTSHPTLLDRLDYLKKARVERAAGIIEKLQSLNIRITLQEVCDEAGAGIPGRPHIARVMQRRKYVPELQIAFERYLGKGNPAYVPKRKLDPHEALRLIRSAGGLSVAAHPYSLLERGLEGLDRLLKELKPKGLHGLEVYYPKHTSKQTRAFRELAVKHDLVVTGGTDFHGAYKPEIELGVVNGRPPLPYSLLEEIKTRRRNLLSGAE